MTTVFTKKQLKPGDEIVVYAPKLKAGEEVKIVRQGFLDPIRLAVCEGEVPPLITPTTQVYPDNPKSQEGTANAHKDYKKLKVKE